MAGFGQTVAQGAGNLFNLISGFHMVKQIQEKNAADAEDRKMQRDLHSFEMKRLQLQDKLQSAITNRTLALQTAEGMQGQPGAPKSVADIVAQVQANLRPQGAAVPNTIVPSEAVGQAPEQPVTPGAQPEEPPQNPVSLTQSFAPQQIPGVDVPELGVKAPGYSYQPKTAEEVKAENLQQLLQGIKVKQLENQRTVTIPGMGTVTLPQEAVGPVISGTIRGQQQKEAQASTAAQNTAKEAGMDKRATIRANATISGAGLRITSQNKNAETDRKQKAILAANSLLVRQNQQRETNSPPALTSPPGTEISTMEKTAQGPGVRRWGYGNTMPTWLAQQYLQQAKGDKMEAGRMAEADGWSIEVK